jgi:beta-N-acetylhexosaminidase
MNPMQLDVGQLLWIGFEGTTVDPLLATRLQEGKAGVAVVFARNLARSPDNEAMSDLVAVRALIRDLAVSGPDGTRCFVAVDQEGGLVQRLRAPATRWPEMMTLDAESFAGLDEALAQQVGEAIGKELRATGFDIDFAPVLDVHTNDANPIIGRRAFGTTPATVSRRALAFASGLAQAGVLSCGKHFPGHGDTVTDSHLALPRVDHGLARLQQVELVPFAAAAAANLPMLMTAHVLFSGLDANVPATLSRHVMTTVLRQQLGYQGVVVSDDLDMKAVADHFGVGQAAVAAIRAGCDAVLLCRNQDFQMQAEQALLAECVASKEFAGQVASSAARIRRMKQDHIARAHEIKPDLASIGCEVHQALAARLRGSV